jgi:hypothetical protein
LGAGIGERVLYIEGERFGGVGKSLKGGLGLMELLVAEAGGCGADAGLGLELLNLHRLTFGTGLGAGGEVFADALAVEPAGEAENDFP